MDEATHDEHDGEPITIGVALAFARVRASMLGTPLDRVVVGRYELHERIGRGGMGAVHRGYDPRLERDVAVKLVPSASSRIRQRMLREAEALARLSHPNVVQIFDVGAYDSRDRDGGQGVFIVMELVRGGTLAQWLREDTPSYDAIIARFVAAGRGLVAAHAAGMIHRDFKPENVLLAGERVLVADFGLARAARHDSEPSSDHAAAPTGSHEIVGGHFGDAITDVGVALGTPPYMAPEQHADAQVDERSDQYSFCVALWEALYGELPFRGANLDALLRAKLLDVPVVHADTRAVPRSIHRAILRGLAADPGARWSTLAELVDTLARGESQRRRWSYRIAGGVAAAGLFAWGGQHVLHSQTQQACAAEGERIAQIWNDARADEIAAGFASLDTHFAIDAAMRVRTGLDAYAAKWKSTRTEVCERADLQRTLAPDLAEASRTCLDEQLDNLNGFLVRLGKPNGIVVQNAGLGVTSLPRPKSCTNEAELRLRAETPPELRERITALGRRLSDSSAARALGNNEAALAEVEPILVEAKALGWPPLTGEVEFALGETLGALGRYEEGRVMLEDAYFVAESAGKEELAMRSATSLVMLVGIELAKHDEGMEWSRRARLFEARLELDDGDLRSAYLSTVTGNVMLVKGDYAGARELFEHALARHEAVLGPDHPGTALTLTSVANVEYATGNYAEAIELFERAVAIFETAFGPDHLDVGLVLGNLGVYYDDFGEPERARECYERSLAIRERVLPADHPDIALALGNLGHAYLDAGDTATALELFERSLAIREKAFGPDHPEIALALHNLIAVYHRQGDYGRGLDLVPRALEIRMKTVGPDHPDVARLLRTRGGLHFANGDRDRALEDYERALVIQEAKLGLAHPETKRTQEAIASARGVAAAQ
ncbi:MAG TPA: serine/threonine-protein kinase [Nannocystaceae bacterium]|nr:serine/threonine-protein kinase [Nannocystaceae bacterium]